jgi:hypothetical protein
MGRSEVAPPTELGNAESPLAASGRFNAQVANWAQIRDCYFETDRVPELLERVEREDDTEAWKELGYRLVPEHDSVSPAGFAALPCLAPDSTEAHGLAGRIMERAAGHHGCDDLPADCADAIAELSEPLDRHLRSRPADHLAAFRALLAVEGQYHWASTSATPRLARPTRRQPPGSRRG